MARGRARRIVFRIFYSTSFTIVFLLTVAFACAGPTDMIYQSYRRRRWIDMFLIAGIYFLTGVLASFLYASRLYTNRSLLKDIPKTFMPVDKDELPAKKVWRLIEDCKNRSAVIAYLARPRAQRVEIEVSYTQARIKTLLQPEHSKDSPIFEPNWGTISHPGWSSPAAKETPNLNYVIVVAELTDLIEARAVSLAPTSPTSPRDGVVAPDDYIIEALRRPEEAGMRQYVAQLVSLNVLEDNSLSTAFLTLYERARFAPNPLSEDEFDGLMRIFAEILRTMKPLNPSHLEDHDDEQGTAQFVDYTDNDSVDLPPNQYATNFGHTRIAGNTNLSDAGSTTSLESSIAGSVRRHQTSQHPRQQSIALPSFIRAPPRVSNDSVRSLSSQDIFTDPGPAAAPTSDAGLDNDAATSQNTSWAEPTARPPFFRDSSSRQRRQQQQRTRIHSLAVDDSDEAAAQTRGNPFAESSRRAALRRTLSSRRSVESNRTGKSSLLSLRSARSGSVIRLNKDYDGSDTALPYEYTKGLGISGNFNEL